MADVDGKQLSVQNADAVRNEADLPTNSACETGISVETSAAANERVDVMVSEGVNVSIQADDLSSCERIANDIQSTGINVANCVKVVRRRRKRTSVREQLASDDAETPVKRRRVQHNYRRLSSAGYVDDYDGRERFSGKQTKPPTRSSLSPSKRKSVSSLSGQTTLRQGASKTTRSRLDTGSHAIEGQCVMYVAGF